MDQFEQLRVAALRSLRVMDSGSEEEFTAIARVASTICETPISLVSLVDSERQWFKANVGLEQFSETSRQVAFCNHTLGEEVLLEVHDAALDGRFSSNPLVLDEGIRFYAGVPIKVAGGLPVGTICVLDHEARTLTSSQRDALRNLAIAAAIALERRRDSLQLREISRLLTNAGELALVGGWEIDLESGSIFWTEQTKDLHEVERSYQPDLEAAMNFFPVGVRQQLTESISKAISERRGWDLEAPFVSAQGNARWVRTIGKPIVESGRVVKLSGAIQDLTEVRNRRLALEHEKVLREQIEEHAKQMETLLRERSDMLDVLAHEVRQPLNNASAAMQSASKALAAIDDDRIASAVSKAQVVLGEVTASIDNHLCVASLLGNPAAIEFVETELNVLLALSIGDMPASERTRISVLSRSSSQTASMDLGLMRLAVRNLLSNALRYSAFGSEVIIELSDCDEPAVGLQIDVISQSGPIAEGLTETLFERTKQARPGQNPRRGLGLGLYIVRRVMQLHHGIAQVVNPSEQALTFRLTLPFGV